MPPHRAAPDSFVTAHILAEMLMTERVSHLVHWTMQPRYYPTRPLTKHKGKKGCDVPHDYLVRMDSPRASELEIDLKLTARAEIERRRAINT